MLFIRYGKLTLSNPAKKVILAVVAGLFVTFLVLLANPKTWASKFEKGALEHNSDFLKDVNHYKELKNEALDIISYLLGLWKNYWS